MGATQSRKGDNLFTCSIVALNADTGKMAWYYQTSPHDAHDWDSTEAPVLFDGTWQGKPRKLVAQAARNGYFFVLDRVTGEHLLTTPLVDPQFLNWSMGINAKGQPINNPKKEASRRRRPGRAGLGGYQLASSELRPADGPFLRGHHREPEHELPCRHVRPAGRLRLHRRRGRQYRRASRASAPSITIRAR